MRTFFPGFLLVFFLLPGAACNGGDPAAPVPTSEESADPPVTKTTPTPNADSEVPSCPIEASLAERAPCMCFDTLVTNTSVQYPDCTSPKAVICCPGLREPVCE